MGQATPSIWRISNSSDKSIYWSMSWSPASICTPAVSSNNFAYVTPSQYSYQQRGIGLRSTKVQKNDRKCVYDNRRVRCWKIEIRKCWCSCPLSYILHEVLSASFYIYHSCSYCYLVCSDTLPKEYCRYCIELYRIGQTVIKDSCQIAWWDRICRKFEDNIGVALGNGLFKEGKLQ